MTRRITGEALCVALPEGTRARITARRGELEQGEWVRRLILRELDDGDRNGALVAKLRRLAAADQTNATQFPEGPVRHALLSRAQMMKDACAALGHVAPLLGDLSPGADLPQPDTEAKGRRKKRPHVPR